MRELSPELGRLLETEWTLAPVVSEMFAQHEIEDDVLRMMFTCCNPRVAEETQIALVLNVVSGFAAPEIAHAFLTSTASIEKRLQRGKASLAESKTLFDFAGERDLGPRLDAVHRALYVLFSEGYHGAHHESAVRADLCVEAMRLVEVLAHHAATKTPETHALAALMALHAARLPSRVAASGDLSPLLEQDRSLWDRALINRGIAWLEESSRGEVLSEYHLEAAIAAEHASAARAEDTLWDRIVEQYDMLFAMRPTPIVALNRAIAITHANGAVGDPEIVTVEIALGARRASP